ncbi:hypothetical protein [Bradyrhizobium sp. 5.13L]
MRMPAIEDDALGTLLDRLNGQQDDEDPVSIVRAKNGKVGEATTPPSPVVGLAPDRIMRGSIVRPTQTAKEAGS